MATLAKGYTFVASDTVTPTKLNNLVDLATITGIATADINSSAITTSLIAANAVTAAKIAAATITGAKIAAGTIEASNIADGTITGPKMNGTFVWPSGSIDFATNNVTFSYDANQIAATAVNSVTTSAGAADAAKVPRLNGSGKLDASFLSNPISIVTGYMSGDIATAASYSTLASVTSTISTGKVYIVSFAVFDHGAGGNAAPVGIGIFQSSTELGSSATDVGSSGGNLQTCQICCFAEDTLSGSTKTYDLKGICKTTGATFKWRDSGASTGDADVHFENNTGIWLIQVGV